jgi:hypothetical protein
LPFVGGPTTEPKTVEGRIINLGFGILIVMFIVAFTGATAGTLISENPKASLTSMDEAVTKGLPICVM